MFTRAKIYRDAIKFDQHPLNWSKEHWYNAGQARHKEIDRFKEIKKRLCKKNEK